MRCPFCGSAVPTKVRDSRSVENHSSIRRRRVCVSCGSRFTTFERIQLRALMINKSTLRSQELFNRDKLLRSILIACRKRPVSEEKIERLVSNIQRYLERQGEAEISSKEIGNMVMKELYSLDQVAYIRFASVYRNFHELEDFKRLINKLDV